MRIQDLKMCANWSAPLKILYYKFSEFKNVFKFWDFQGKNDQVKVEICCNRLDVFGPATDKMMAVQV